MFFLYVAQISSCSIQQQRHSSLKLSVRWFGPAAWGDGFLRCPSAALKTTHRSAVPGAGDTDLDPQSPFLLVPQSSWGYTVPLALQLVWRTLGCDSTEIGACSTLPLHVCSHGKYPRPKNPSGRNKYWLPLALHVTQVVVSDLPDCKLSHFL